jgi:hypothetical protein
MTYSNNVKDKKNSSRTLAATDQNAVQQREDRPKQKASVRLPTKGTTNDSGIPFCPDYLQKSARYEDAPEITLGLLRRFLFCRVEVWRLSDAAAPV